MDVALWCTYSDLTHLIRQINSHPYPSSQKWCIVVRWKHEMFFDGSGGGRSDAPCSNAISGSDKVLYTWNSDLSRRTQSGARWKFHYTRFHLLWRNEISICANGSFAVTTPGIITSWEKPTQTAPTESTKISTSRNNEPTPHMLPIRYLFCWLV